MNIHAISQRSHWSTQIYAIRCRPTPDDVVRQNVVLIEPSSTSTTATQVGSGGQFSPSV